MDDIDRNLLLLMAAQPRIHFQELAEKLGISRQAVHHRVRVLMQVGVIKNMSAGISLSYLKAVPVVVFGISRAASLEKSLDKLGENDMSRRANLAGGNYVYVVGILRGISDLGGYVDFVKRAVEMPDPTVGIFCLDDGLMPYYSVDGAARQRQDHRRLSPLDLRIIASLRDNARRPVGEIAQTIGVSPKTVGRRLEAMISEGSIEFWMPSDLSIGGDLCLAMHVTLKDGVDRREMGARLLSEFPFRDAYVRTLTNLPNLLLWVFWSDSMVDIRRALSEVGSDRNVAGVMLNFIHAERIYTTWRDRLPETEEPLAFGKASRRKSRAKARPS